MSMYLGLSGKKGSSRSSISAGIPVSPSIRGHPGHRGNRYNFFLFFFYPPKKLFVEDALQHQKSIKEAFTCAVSQYVSDAQHLCTEDANGDEELRNDAKGSP